MKPIKIINGIILIVFCTYWGFVFFSFTQAKTKWWKDFYTKTFVHSTVPPVYRMYTSPPKSNVYVEVSYYKNNQLLGKEEFLNFVKNYRKKSFFDLEGLKLRYTRDLYTKPLYYGVVNNMYDYYEEGIDSITMQEYLLHKGKNKVYFGNQKLVPNLIKKYKQTYKKSDSFNVSILRYPIVLEMDENTKEKFSYWIKDTLAYKAGDKL